MSEYQCYEFVALDRPLTAKHMAELRRISTRAEISPTRFWNEYQWGDLKADPAALVGRYFDAHLYFANWGTHRLMLRIPKARLNTKALKPFFVGEQTAKLKSVGEHIVLDLSSDTEEPEFGEESPGLLAALSPLRAELMRGDLRCAYLAWLLAVDAEEVDDDATEPPVPAGLATLTTAQTVMVEFLRIDVDLLVAAAAGSALLVDDSESFRRWVARLPVKEKDAWLRRAADAPELALGGEMLRAYCATGKREQTGVRRKVAELRAAAARQCALREGAEAERAKRAKAAAEGVTRRRLNNLARDVDAAWVKVEALVASSSYDEAAKLAADLRDLATRDGQAAGFVKRFDAMRKRQSRRRAFFDRWKRRVEVEPGEW